MKPDETQLGVLGHSDHMAHNGGATDFVFALGIGSGNNWSTLVHWNPQCLKRKRQICL